MSGRRKLFIVLVIIVIIIAGLSIFNVYHLNYEGEKAIAEKKAREVFFWKHFPWTIGPYHVSIQNQSIPFYNQHTIYSVQGYIGGVHPPMAHITIAVGKDGKAFVLPDEFNKVIQREKINVESKRTALNLAKEYIHLAKRYTFKEGIINNVSDIPGTSSKDEEKLKGKIKPPNIYLKNNSYIVECFTYRSIGGVVRYWELEIGRNGTISVIKNKEVFSNIGTVVGIA